MTQEGANPPGDPIADVATGKKDHLSCKDLFTTGTWNVRSLNIGKLEIIKHEMTRTGLDLLGISELH